MSFLGDPEERANKSIVNAGRALTTGTVDTAKVCIDGLEMQYLDKYQLFTALLQLIDLAYSTEGMDEIARYDFYQHLERACHPDNLGATTSLLAIVLDSGLSEQVVLDYVTGTYVNFRGAFDRVIRTTDEPRSLQLLINAMAPTAAELQEVMGFYTDIRVESYDVLARACATQITAPRPTYVLAPPAPATHETWQLDLLIHRYDEPFSLAKAARRLRRTTKRNSPLLIDKGLKARGFVAIYKLLIAPPPLRQIVCREIGLPYPALQSDIVAFQRFGPYNPIGQSYDAVQGHMLTCYYNDNINECGAQLVPDDEFGFNPEIGWFTGVCDGDAKTISYLHEAVRRPIVWGGWFGCFCSWRCVRKTCNDRELILVAYFEDQLNQLGIFERSYTRAPPLIVPFLNPLFGDPAPSPQPPLLLVKELTSATMNEYDSHTAFVAKRCHHTVRAHIRQTGETALIDLDIEEVSEEEVNLEEYED